MTDAATAICKALAHPARRALLQALSRGECDVGRLSAGLRLDQPTVSKSLATLRAAGLVRVRVDGRRRCYSVNHEEIVRPLLGLLAELEAQDAEKAPDAGKGAAHGAQGGVPVGRRSGHW
ncbi:MAG: metalloregulator ArsR/SmtB family transcription factor [Thermoleophilia bacterium]